MFKSTDELEHFSFNDCVLTDIAKSEDGLVLSAEALIVNANNSANENFTDSYAGPTDIKIVNGSLVGLIKVGFKYYNADGVLIKEVPDTPVNKLEWDSLIKTLPGNYLVSLKKEEEFFEAEIEIEESDGTVGNSYLLKLSGDSVTVTWEYYMNRVQK